MSLLDKIRLINPNAAIELEAAGFRTDSEIKSLDRTDICELFGGTKNLKLRKEILEVIHPKRPADDLVRELKDVIPHETALARSSVLADYLHVLKDMKTQMDSVQKFLNAHISLLEELSNARPRQKTDTLPGAKTSDPCGPEAPNCGNIYTPPEIPEDDVISGLDTCNKNNVHSLVNVHSLNPQDLGGTERRKVGAEDGGNSSVPLPELKEVKYSMTVSGETFNAHRQLMYKVMNDDQAQSYQFSESSRDHQVTLLFRAITSRRESDAEAAMSEITDDKPVILVLMHHELCPLSIWWQWKDNPKVVLTVHVFFHETKSGLLTCKENSDAITAIRNKLLEYSTRTIPEENLKCERERRKEAEGGNKKQDLYEDKQSSKKSLTQSLGVFSIFRR